MIAPPGRPPHSRTFWDQPIAVPEGYTPSEDEVEEARPATPPKSKGRPALRLVPGGLDAPSEPAQPSAPPSGAPAAEDAPSDRPGPSLAVPARLPKPPKPPKPKARKPAKKAPKKAPRKKPR